MKLQVESKLRAIIASKIQEYRVNENISGSDGQQEEEMERHVGFTFSEFYHELFMAILSTVKR